MCLCAKLYITLISLAIFIVPAIIIAVCYALIVSVIWRQSSSIMTSSGRTGKRHRRGIKTSSSTWSKSRLRSCMKIRQIVGRKNRYRSTLCERCVNVEDGSVCRKALYDVILFAVQNAWPKGKWSCILPEDKNFRCHHKSSGLGYIFGRVTY